MSLRERFHGYSEFLNGKTISDEQRARFPGEYNSTVALARRTMTGLCAASMLTLVYVFAGTPGIPNDPETPHNASPSIADTLQP